MRLGKARHGRFSWRWPGSVRQVSNARFHSRHANENAAEIRPFIQSVRESLAEVGVGRLRAGPEFPHA